MTTKAWLNLIAILLITISFFCYCINKKTKKDLGKIAAVGYYLSLSGTFLALVALGLN